MTWTYTSTDPGATTRDQVRFKTGDDVSAAVPTLTDEEIAFALSECSDNIISSAIMCLRSLVRRAAKYASFTTTGGLSIQVAQRYAQLKESLLELELEADRDALGAASMYVGGDLQDDDDDLDEDTDRNQPHFRRDRGSWREPYPDDETY